MNQNLYFAWDPELRRCPHAILTPDIWAMVDWYRDWRELGALPWPGDILDQPGYVVDVIRTCVRVEAEIRAGEEARQNRELERLERMAREGK